MDILATTPPKDLVLIGGAAAAPEEKDLTGNLPDELLDHVFFFLDNKALFQAQSVCRRWRSRAPAAAKTIHIFTLNDLFGFLKGQLAEARFSDQRKQLVKIEIKILEPTSLNDARVKAQAIQDTALDVLVQLEDTVLDTLAHNAMDRPKFFQTTIHLAKLYQEAATINELPDGLEKLQGLGVISGEFREMKETQRALVAAHAIPNEWVKSQSLLPLCEQLAKLGKFERAIDVARSISYTLNHSLALSSISIELANRKDIDGALELFKEALQSANTIFLKGEKSQALSATTNLLLHISDQLIEMGQLEKALRIIMNALDIALSIDNERHQSWALLDVSKSFAKTGRPAMALSAANEALEAARSIPDRERWQRHDALSAISRHFADLERMCT